ncbi:OmpA family protein [Methylobacterium sp. A54F]
MRKTRLLLLTGTMLPGLALGTPSFAEPGALEPGRLILAQRDPGEPGGPGGPRPDRGGPERGGAERGGPGGGGRPDRGGPERGGPERAAPAERPAARERPEPRPERQERPERPDRPERGAPAPERAAPPQPRERPAPVERPTPGERPAPAQERPAARPERPERPERAPPVPRQDREPAERPAPQRTPDRSGAPERPAAPERAAPTPERREAPEPNRRAPEPPAQRPVPPPPGEPRGAPEQSRPPAPNAQPGVPGRPVQPQGGPPAAGTVPNAQPGVPGRPVQPQGGPGQAPNAQPGVPGQPVRRPGEAPPAAGPGAPPPNVAPQTAAPPAAPNAQPGVPGRPVQPPGVPPSNGVTPGVQPGVQPGLPAGRVDDRDRRGDFNVPGRPGYVPGGFRDDEDIRDYDRIRRDRREFNEDGRTYIREPGRIIVRDRDRTFIRHDENERFRDLDRRAYRSERRGQETYTYLDRPGGEQIVTIVDDDGRLLRRSRRFRDGREVVIIDNAYGGRPRPVYEDVVDLPPPDIRIPRERYVVDYEGADERTVYEALAAPPVVPIDRRYTLDQVRYSPQLRARMRSVDIDTINFDTGSFTVTPDQARRLSTIAAAINQAVRANPQEVFLIEGYTDAVGNDVDNLSLSDRRAQSVATVLTQQFQVPPENLTTQGYGEQYLKVNTQNAARENRRVTVRRITPLIQQGQAGQGEPPR